MCEPLGGFGWLWDELVFQRAVLSGDLGLTFRGMDGCVGAQNSGPLSLESITGVDEAQFIFC